MNKLKEKSVPNQCDGCLRNLPMKNGAHYTKEGRIDTYCTKDRYSSQDLEGEKKIPPFRMITDPEEIKNSGGGGGSKPVSEGECNCKEITCKFNCKERHTHKSFWCEKCRPDLFYKPVSEGKCECGHFERYHRAARFQDSCTFGNCPCPKLISEFTPPSNALRSEEDKDYSTASFIREFMNDHNGRPRWLRSIFIDEPEKICTILEWMEGIEAKVVSARADERKKIGEIIRDWSPEHWNEQSLAEMKMDILTILKDKLK